jgi:hypothetical protein
MTGILVAALALAAFPVAIAQPVIDPMQRDALPGGLQPVPIVTLNISSTSTRTVPVLVAANGSLPAVDFQVATAGGVAPVTFAIAGGAAAAMFQILPTQAATMTPQPTAAQTAAAAMEAQVNPRSAGTSTRTVRFKGAASAAGLPAVLPVQIRATDARGASVTLDVAAYVYAPAVAPLTLNRTALQSGQVTFTVQGLGNAAEMRVDSIGGGCGYTQNDNIGYGSAVRPVTNGRATVGRMASFRTNGGSCAGLRITAAFRFPDSATFMAPLALTVPTFSFVAPQIYTFENTWTLRNLFGFALRTAHTGVCSGDSIGTAGTHKVGIVESSDDIAMTIRSGPLGTECDYVSKAVRLPDGFVLRELDLAQTEGPNDSLTNVRMSEPRHYCRIGGSGGTVGGLVSFNMTRGTRVIRSPDIDEMNQSSDPVTVQGWDWKLNTPDGVTLVDRSDSLFAVVLMPMYLKLRCVITPSNTEFIRVRLNRAVFVGPPGVAFP